MIPVLYESTTTTFTNLGLGELPDALSCKVTSERNGMMSLEMEYPTNGLHYSDIAIGRIIRAAILRVDSFQNIFVIESIDYSMDGTIKVYAPAYACFRLSSAIRFTSYENYVWTKGDSATGDDVHDVMSALRSNVRPQLSRLADAYDRTIVPAMTFSGNISRPTGTSVDIVWGKENPTAFEVVQAVADAFGGEIFWSRRQVVILQQIGEDTGLEIRYGSNMTALDAETDGEPYVTAVVPEGSGASGYVRADTPGIYPFFRVAVADLSGTTASAYIQEAQKLKTSIKVQFDPFGNATNVDTDSGWLQRLGVCDIVTVVHPELELKQKTKIVKTVFNVLEERYESMDIGEVVQDITDTIAAMIKNQNTVRGETENGTSS